MKQITLHPNYSITHNGLVWSHLRVYQSGKGNIRTTGGRYLYGHPDVDGYLHVYLYNNGKRTTANIHRLVAEAFIPNPNNLPQINHKDTNKQNNHIDNLEWCTAKENTQHAIKNGLR